MFAFSNIIILSAARDYAFFIIVATPHAMIPTFIGTIDLYLHILVERRIAVGKCVPRVIIKMQAIASLRKKWIPIPNRVHSFTCNWK